MPKLTVAIAAALLCWGAATAQTGPPPAPPAGQFALPPTGAPPDGTADIWSRMTTEQRKQLWQRLTPEERANIWQRLPPQQQQQIREHLAPQRPAGPGQPPDLRAGAGPKLSPEERRTLREQIREAHQMRRGHLGRP